MTRVFKASMGRRAVIKTSSWFWFLSANYLDGPEHFYKTHLGVLILDAVGKEGRVSGCGVYRPNSSSVSYSLCWFRGVRLRPSFFPLSRVDPLHKWPRHALKEMISAAGQKESSGRHLVAVGAGILVAGPQGTHLARAWLPSYFSR